MAKKHTDQLIQSNQEYVKLQKSQAPGEDRTPRETPGQRAAGNRGHRLPQYDRWTTRELADYARKLGYAAGTTAETDTEAGEDPATSAAQREALVDFIISRDASRRNA